MPAYFDNLIRDYFGALEPYWLTNSLTQRIIPATIPKIYDDILFGAARGVRVDQGASGVTVEVPLMSIDTACALKIEQVDLTDIEVRIVEGSGVVATVYSPDTPPYYNDAGTAVRFSIPNEIINLAGVYHAQIRITNKQNPPIELTRDNCYIYIERGLWSTNQGEVPSAIFGPPTFQEIRTILRDHPGANRLLEDYEFHPAEISLAVIRTVQHFNSEFPLVGTPMTTQNISSVGRYPITNGVIANLLEIIASFFRRNQLPYRSGESNVADLTREREYLQAMSYFRQVYEKWILTTKQTVNFFGMYGAVSSGYPGRAVRAIF